MNPRTLLKEFAEDIDRDRMVTAVYGEMVDYCRENDITENDISTPELEQLAEGFVERGFSFDGGPRTYKPISQMSDEELEKFAGELGSASDGTEADR